MKRRDLIRHLLDHGCELVREGGNHSWWATHRQVLAPPCPAIVKSQIILH